MATQSQRADVRDHLPELREIADDDLRERVVEVWADAVADVEHESIADVPRSTTPVPDASDQRTERIVPHVRDVTVCAMALADCLADRLGVTIDRDAVVAAALVHDVSKAYELSETAMPGLDDLLIHPHYAIHLLAAHGFSTHVVHIVAAHSHNTAVEPATLEAQLVYHADMAALHGLFWHETGELAAHV